MIEARKRRGDRSRSGGPLDRGARRPGRASRSALRPGLAALGVVLALVLGPGSKAAADDLATAQALYARGEMAAAAEMAHRVGGAEALTLAAKATLVAALYQAPAADQARLLRRAARAARQALALDPDSAAACLQLALVLGQMAERVGPIAAHLDGYAKEGHQLLERAHRLAPDDPWPEGLLGIWHLQLVHHGSAMLAGELYGASEAEGLRLCRQAAERAPAAIALRYGCAVSMLELSPERHGPEALQTLGAITEMPAADAAEWLIQQAARRQIDGFRRSHAR